GGGRLRESGPARGGGAALGPRGRRGGRAPAPRVRAARGGAGRRAGAAAVRARRGGFGFRGHDSARMGAGGVLPLRAARLAAALGPRSGGADAPGGARSRVRALGGGGVQLPPGARARGYGAGRTVWRSGGAAPAR